jgi:general secretion pathway protein H
MFRQFDRLPMRSRLRGFTLLEMLVVVVIAAILTALVALRLGDWRSPDDPQHQLERLAALIEAQCQQAVFQSRPRGLRVTDAGYDFWQATSAGWVPLRGDGINRVRDWAGEVSPELLVDGHRLRLDNEPEGPQIICQPLGELTGFEVSLEFDQRRWFLTGRGDGRLDVRLPAS